MNENDIIAHTAANLSKDAAQVSVEAARIAGLSELDSLKRNARERTAAAKAKATDMMDAAKAKATDLSDAARAKADNLAAAARKKVADGLDAISDAARQAAEKVGQ